MHFELFLTVQIILEPLIGYWAWIGSSSDNFFILTFAVLEFGRSGRARFFFGGGLFRDVFNTFLLFDAEGRMHCISLQLQSYMSDQGKSFNQAPH